MARHRVGDFPSLTMACNLVTIERIGVRDHWCIFHGAYALTCLDCGRDFHAKRPQTKYCSTACSQRAYRERIKS